MNPTLAEILEYASFQRAEPRVLAGTSSLDRRVRWIHISEMTDVGDLLLRGGELLLTQGRGIPPDELGQRRWVRALVDEDVVGVGVELGEVIDEIPPAVVDEARTLDLAVIALSDQAYFMDMTEAVHSTIVNLHYRMLQRAEHASAELSRLALEGCGPRTIIEKLSELLGNPVVLADHAHEVVEYAPQTSAVVEVLQSWHRHARRGHELPSDGLAQTERGDVSCVWVPILFRKELWGSIHVLDLDREVDQADRLSLDRAAAAIGLAFAADDSHPQEGDTQSSLVRDLVDSYHTDPAPLLKRARAVGADLSGPLRLLVVRPVDPRVDDADTAVPRRRLGRALRAASASVRKAFGHGATRPLTGYDGSQLLVVVADHDRDRLVRQAEQVCRECSLDQDVTLVVGVSATATVESLPQARLDADDAVRYALHTEHGPRVMLSEELGVNRLLLDLDASGALVRHVERELGALLDHDARGAVPLLPTLSAYLECGGSKTRAADRLNVQRRTLYYRLSQIEGLVQGDLDEVETRLRLLLALRGLQMRRKSLHTRREVYGMRR